MGQGRVVLTPESRLYRPELITLSRCFSGAGPLNSLSRGEHHMQPLLEPLHQHVVLVVGAAVGTEPLLNVRGVIADISTQMASDALPVL